MPLTLVSFIACSAERLSMWSPADYQAYKITRAIAGRRIAGSAWLPIADGGVTRVSNANVEVAVRWFVDRAVPPLESAIRGDRRPVLVPIPGPHRIVGAPPSGSRHLAQELSGRTGLRTLDVLRWRQKMPRWATLDPQFFLDNLITSGSPFRADCVLVADCLSSGAPAQAAAVRLQQMGSSAVLALSVGRVVRQPPENPFTTEAQVLGDPAIVTA